MAYRFERMPNGEMVRVPEGISRTELRKVRDKYREKPKPAETPKPRGASAGSRNAPLTPQEQAIQKRQSELSGGRATQRGIGSIASAAQSFFSGNPVGAIGNLVTGANQLTQGNVAGGASFNFDDEAAGAVAGLKAAPRAVMEGSFDPIREDYRVEQQARDRSKKQYQRDNPGAATAAQVAGGLALPFAGTGNTLFKVGSGARAAGATRTARAAQRTAARMRQSGPIGRGITTGAAFGGLNAAGNSNELSEVPRNLALGTVMGGITGGVFGAGMQGATTAFRAVRDRGDPQAITSRAYKRVESLIDNVRDKKDKPATPSQLRNQIIGRNRTGADTRVMDMSPGLRAEAAFLGRQTNIPNSNRLQDLAEERILQRQGRFVDQSTKRAKTGGVDARAQREGIDEARSKQGDVDYRDGGPLDNQMQWDDELQEFFSNAGPTTQNALKRAYNIMRDERRQPELMGLNENGTLEKLPTFRTLDYLKRGYNDLIESAIGSGNRAQAGRVSAELNLLKNMLINQNSEYGMILATQRDAFQKLRASELGEKVFTRMKTRPREMYKELLTLKGSEKDDARIGIIDALLNLETKADPVNAMRAYLRTPAQRKILEFAFGDKKRLESFERYVENEFKASVSDRFISSGRQSLTGTLEQAGMSQADALGEIGGQAIKGYGFGGEVGLIANTVQGVRRAASNINPGVQDEIARILMSKGEDLERGIMQAARFFARRRATDSERTARAARAAATPFGASIGDN